MTQVSWDVFLNGKWIDTVYFTDDCDEAYVKNSLINHDGYDPRIVIQHPAVRMKRK